LPGLRAGVVQAPAPERLIKSGLPTEAMVAYVLVAKYAWHLPLYRQAQMLLAQGLDIKRAILAFWVGYAAAELKPLYLRLRELILAGSAPIASEALERIAALYAIEKTIRGHTAFERRAVRQEQSKPLVLELKRWFERKRPSDRTALTA